MIVLNGYTAVIVAKTMPVFIQVTSWMWAGAKQLPSAVQANWCMTVSITFNIPRKGQKVQITKSELKDK